MRFFSCMTSAALYRGVIYFGQFQSKETTSIKNTPLNGGAGVRFSKLLHEFRGGLGHPRISEDLQALAARIVLRKSETRSLIATLPVLSSCRLPR